ncbi:hypothetical protein E1180_04185 [Roseibium denhamense]|uniref:Uncharacterized protein n=1 Tax=Roseibium denhamense TaxID=76305 RepID=A0ABY1PIS4_9HYPH|nr:hypothetical protein [Roseibium denhamense]MTI04713.1 hypothetical protein [Roseibium denhamense]SMP33662.1 hypothetical protein SAMN06265374_3823 [Roseibium denhamense]
MRKPALFLTTLACASAIALSAAAARPDLRQMSCAAAQEMVRQHGAVVFTTGQYTYSKFVSNLRYCDSREMLFTQYGPTRDVKKCPVAYECREPLFPFGPFGRD